MKYFLADVLLKEPHIDTLDMQGCICHFAKWQIHPFISKETICWHINFEKISLYEVE